MNIKLIFLNTYFLKKFMLYYNFIFQFNVFEYYFEFLFLFISTYTNVSIGILFIKKVILLNA